MGDKLPLFKLAKIILSKINKTREKTEKALLSLDRDHI